MFDLVITHDKEEKDKIMKPTEAFQLQNGSTYTYINSFSKDFYLYPKDYYFGDDSRMCAGWDAAIDAGTIRRD